MAHWQRRPLPRRSFHVFPQTFNCWVITRTWYLEDTVTQIRLYIKQILTQSSSGTPRFQDPSSGFATFQWWMPRVQHLYAPKTANRTLNTTNRWLYTYTVLYFSILFSIYFIWSSADIVHVVSAIEFWGNLGSCLELESYLGAPFLEFSIYVSIAGNFETVESLLGNQMEEIYMQFLRWSKI